MGSILGIDFEDIREGIQIRSLYDLSRQAPALTAGLDPTMLSAYTARAAGSTDNSVKADPPPVATPIQGLTMDPMLMLAVGALVLVLLSRR